LINIINFQGKNILGNTIDIGRKDVIWNYAATFLQIGAGIILLPLILREFPQETVAIWTIFLTAITLTNLLDFGFHSSFARNITYVISGITELKTTGFQVINNNNGEIDYSLLKGLIHTMRWFYARVAAILLILLSTAGTYYIYTILKKYTGNHAEVYISWFVLAINNSYSLYTTYYDSLMQGKGLIKRNKQIQIVGQTIYLAVAVVLILLHFNLIAIVSAQALSIVIRRLLAYYTIYTPNFKHCLRNAGTKPLKEILKPIYPNAVKMGLTGFGGFLVQRSAMIIGALYLPLNDMASYGITIQITGIIASIAGVYLASYQPKTVQLRAQNDNLAIKYIYLKGCLLLVCTFVIGGLALLFLGDWTLSLIKSQTLLLSKSLVILALFVSLLETNHSNAAGILLTKNEVPFFKPAIVSGICIVLGLFLVLKYTEFGVMGLILVPLIVNVAYQSWKWPWEVIKDLKINILNYGR
jgi:O-antigen/teichoic acid export membrane protein